jgi:hypothetical protein
LISVAVRRDCRTTQTNSCLKDAVAASTQSHSSTTKCSFKPVFHVAYYERSDRYQLQFTMIKHGEPLVLEDILYLSFRERMHRAVQLTASNLTHDVCQIAPSFRALHPISPKSSSTLFAGRRRLAGNHNFVLRARACSCHILVYVLAPAWQLEMHWPAACRQSRTN